MMDCTFTDLYVTKWNIHRFHVLFLNMKTITEHKQPNVSAQDLS